ncbi:MAG TPA: riboflavin biosynthesis protein RibF [Candidatus Baltobacteraceae bacterium]|nr:riboflavin biosynthesis protein RibF [Candidatus Baltobacteraceae bacterium]
MIVHHELQAKGDRPIILSIGFFDGLHRGHREILRALLRKRRPGYRALVLTFDRHPRAFLRPGEEPPLITTLEERVDLLARCDVDELYLLPFDERIARLSWREFLSLLIERFNLRALVVGENFRFGAGRTGDVAAVIGFFSERGIDVEALAPVIEDGERISSTRIREALAAGEIPYADRRLWMPYSIRGRVVLGEGRGHELGFPTANLEIGTEKLLPKDGVYSVTARHEGRDYPGLASIGTKPMFGGRERVVEVWLRDFRETIYGEQVAVRNLRFVREQRTFANVGELSSQMREDAKHAAFPAFVE